MNPAVIYTRFSPRPSPEEARSIEVQLHRCTDYAALHGLDPLHVIKDPEVSARTTPLHDREGGRKLIELVNNGGVKHIIAQRLDRLFRSLEGRAVMEAWYKNGVVVHLVDQGGNSLSLDLGSWVGRFIITQLLVIAEVEPAMIAERTSGAMLHHQEEGRVMSKQPPYGKRIEEGRLVDDPLERDIIEAVLRRHESGASATTIARFLENGNCPTRSGKPWRHSTIQRIIDRYGKK